MKADETLKDYTASRLLSSKSFDLEMLNCMHLTKRLLSKEAITQNARKPFLKKECI